MPELTDRKGIILAGGTGSRLSPLTKAVSKQLMPIYDKPMIYYPLTILMQANISEILIITTPQDKHQYKNLLGDGSQWGLQLEYQTQARPDGLAQAFILADKFLNGAPSAMILGDNIFFGHGLPEMLRNANKRTDKSTIFGYHVADPERYGVLGFDQNGIVKTIIEKPDLPQSNYAVTGLYFLDGTAPKRAKNLKPSARGELEITSLLETYLKDGDLYVETMGNGYAWLDTGTHSSLLDASNFVRTLIERQGLQVGSPDEIAYKLKWITKGQLAKNAQVFGKNIYGQYLQNL